MKLGVIFISLLLSGQAFGGDVMFRESIKEKEKHEKFVNDNQVIPRAGEMRRLGAEAYEEAQEKKKLEKEEEELEEERQIAGFAADVRARIKVAIEDANREGERQVIVVLPDYEAGHRPGWAISRVIRELQELGYEAERMHRTHTQDSRRRVEVKWGKKGE